MIENTVCKVLKVARKNNGYAKIQFDGRDSHIGDDTGFCRELGCPLYKRCTLRGDLVATPDKEHILRNRMFVPSNSAELLAFIENNTKTTI